MLAVAARNCAGRNVCLLQQDIRCLRLPCPVDLITANFDTVNHIMEDAELKSVFRRIWKNLNPGGHFIFDLITPCQPLGGGRTYTRRLGSGSGAALQRIRWSARMKTLSISVVIRPRTSLLSVMELHRERAHAPANVARWLTDAGFVIRGVHDAVTLRIATVCPPRIIVIARKLSPTGPAATP
jgi:SAM-dependent methyltransferase